MMDEQAQQMQLNIDALLAPRAANQQVANVSPEDAARRLLASAYLNPGCHYDELKRNKQL